MDSNKNTPKEKSTVKKATLKKAAPKKATPKKAVANKAVTKKVAPKKPEVKKAAPQKVEAKKAASKTEAPKKEAPKKKNFFSRLLGTVTENVVEGATFVGEKVAATSAKAYVAGTEIVHETSEKIHDFTEKQALHKEEDKIEERQTTLKYAFGEITLAKYLETEALPKSFLTTKHLVEIVSEFKSNTKRLLEIEKQIKELENH